MIDVDVITLNPTHTKIDLFQRRNPLLATVGGAGVSAATLLPVLAGVRVCRAGSVDDDAVVSAGPGLHRLLPGDIAASPDGLKSPENCVHFPATSR